MSVTYHEGNKTFLLNTPLSSYAIALAYAENLLVHLHYGRHVDDGDLLYLLGQKDGLTAALEFDRDKVSALDRLPFEYPSAGLGDFRESCLDVKTEEGHTGCLLSYVSHKIYKGKNKLDNLPATAAAPEECETLEITCADKLLGLEVTLVYNVYEDLDVITRHVKIKNNSNRQIFLEKVLSACVDIPVNNDFEMIRLHGSWARERSISRVPLGFGKTSAESCRGESSHQSHPFFALVNKNTSQDSGEVYAFHLVYSGNFLSVCELTQFNCVRAVIGINPYQFSWGLEPSGEFTSPEAVMVYSHEGIGKMTRTLHALYRRHLIRGKYRDAKRPVLINNWEATYFNFDTDKLLGIAKEASSLGIEMLVLDDGWFGARGDDNTSLGDWYVNEDKIKGGLKFLAGEVNKLGMKFGIWMEPEMVSPDSDLYRAHPDWAISLPGRAASLCRNQYVLDLSRRDVLEYVYGCVAGVLGSANISYLKWDMNRPLTDLGGAALKNQGELSHRYVLGVYELQERLVTDFPDLLLENCSGGGGRFDPGMLYYSPQIWCSDDTDAIERLAIQEGTALIYPLSSIGAHVSDCPNHTVGRTTPFETRGIVALAGTFGYELDVTKLSREDRRMIPGQIEAYHKYNGLVREGDYYRIASYSDNRLYDCWQIVSGDMSESLITFVNVTARPNGRKTLVRLKGLDGGAKYTDNSSGAVYSGAALMHAGFLIDCPGGDFKAVLIYITKK